MSLKYNMRNFVRNATRRAANAAVMSGVIILLLIVTGCQHNSPLYVLASNPETTYFLDVNQPSPIQGRVMTVYLFNRLQDAKNYAIQNGYTW
jgi:hypothetical protein